MSNALVIYEPRRLTKQEQLQHIFAEVASGRSLHSVLTEDEGMPHGRTFWQWHMTDERVRSDLARARETGVEALLEKAIHVAETPMEAVELMEEAGVDGIKRRRTVKEALGHRRLIIETYVKRAQMIQPRYGQSVNVKHEGEIGVRKVDELDDVARATRLAAVFQQMQRRLEASDE